MTPGGRELALTRILLVGREREIGERPDVRCAAGDGAGGLIFVSGARGIGKTRLVERPAIEANALGWAHATTDDATTPIVGHFARSVGRLSEKASLPITLENLEMGGRGVARR